MKKSRLVSAVVSLFLLIGIMAGCSVVDNTSVATVNGEKILEKEFVLYLFNEQSMMLSSAGVATEEDAKAFWEADGNADTARKNAIEEAIKTEIKCQKAAEMGITLTDEEKAQIKTYIGTSVTQAGGQAAFDEQLKKIGTTEEAYTNFFESMYLVDKLNAALTEKDEYKVTEEDAKARIEETYIRAKHILISTIDPMTGVKLSAEEAAAAKTQADDLCKQIKDGADFDKLMNEYSTDPGLATAPEGYEFGKGQMVPEFENAAYALEVGQVSDPVETSYGYHIIKREKLSLTDEKITEFLPMEIQIMQYEKFDEAYEEWKAAATIEIDDGNLADVDIIQ